MEIEAKFRVEDEHLFLALLGLNALGPFRLVAAANPEHQRNIYFDTPDGRLRSRRYGLRVRDLGARRIATLKGEARVQQGMYEREEWEVEIGDRDDPAAWPPGELRDRALALSGGAPLAPLLAVDTRRRHIYAFRGDARVAEVSLDEGTIRAGGHAQPFRELEVELLKEGTRADLESLCELLRGRFSLIPEDRSKLARGLALLDER